MSEENMFSLLSTKIKENGYKVVWNRDKLIKFVHEPIAWKKENNGSYAGFFVQPKDSGCCIVLKWGGHGKNNKISDSQYETAIKELKEEIENKKVGKLNKSTRKEPDKNFQEGISINVLNSVDYNNLETLSDIESFVKAFVEWDEENKNTFKQITDTILEKYGEDMVDEVAEDVEKEKLLAKTQTLLLDNHNIILHGAPGTGKTYLAKEIAKSLIFGENKNALSEEEQKQFNEQCGFVQFHQSYDYTDFVEGLRPKTGSDGKIGFEPKDGIFKKFCTKALKNLVDSNKEDSEYRNEVIWSERCKAFLEEYCFDGEKEIKFLETETYKKKFYIDDYNDNTISIAIPDNEKITSLSLNRKDLLKAFKTASHWDSVESFKDAIGKKYRHPAYYLLTIANKIGSMNSETKDSSVRPMKKHYVFIIDEINRGEMSKVFGELFYSVDPGYRVEYKDLKSDDLITVQTQYANLQEKNNDFDDALGITDDEKDNHGHFFVPENVYIIGTMNDIDRSVESMDFAMRRRFAFVNVSAKDRIEMLTDKEHGLENDVAKEAINRMNNLNEAIEDEPGLSPAYHIGPAYFLKMKKYGKDFDKLWNNHIKGVLTEYLRGSGNESDLEDKLKIAYQDTTEHPEKN